MIEMFPIPGFWWMQVVGNFLSFEIYVFIFVCVSLFLFLKAHTYKDILFAVIAVGLYKYLTLSLFGNSTCMCSGNTYPDVSVINIFIGMLDVGTLLIAKYLSERCKMNRKYRFTLLLLLTYFIFLVNEMIIQSMGIRSYTEDISNLLSQSTFLMLPIENIPYILAVAFYTVGIYSFLEKVDQAKTKNVPQSSFTKTLWISIISVFALQIIVHPIFLDTWLPEFTYLYQDINWLVTILWSLAIATILTLIGKGRFDIYQDLICSFFGILIFNLILFIVLFQIGILRIAPSVNDYLWGINFFGLPIEAITGLTIATLIKVLCIKKF